MSIQIRLILMISTLLNMSCSKNDIGGATWGIEEPLVVTNNQPYLITKLNQQDGENLNLSDQINFDEKYDEQNISLKITSTCGELVQTFSMKLKSTVFFYEIIPYQVYLSTSFNKDMSCAFNFLATNTTGKSHQFSLNKILISLDQAGTNFKKLTIKKYDAVTGKDVTTKLGDEIFDDELRIENSISNGDYYSVCKKSVEKIYLGSIVKPKVVGKSISRPIDVCKVLFVSERLSAMSENKISQAFIFKIRPQPPVVEINNVTMNKLISYGQDINGFSFSITNKSNTKVTYAIKRGTLDASIHIIRDLKPKYRLIKKVKLKTGVALAPILSDENGVLLRHEKELYFISLGAKSKKIFYVNYKLGSIASFEKKLNCKMAISYKINGYSLLYPRRINLNQIDVYKNKKITLTKENIIQPHVFVTNFKSVEHKYTRNYVLCTDKSYRARMGRLPGALGGTSIF